MIKSILSLAMLCGLGLAVPAQAEVATIHQRPHVGAEGLPMSDEALVQLVAESSHQPLMQLAGGPHRHHHHRHHDHHGYRGHRGHDHHHHHHHNHRAFRVNYYPVYPAYPSYGYYQYQPYYRSGLSFSFGF